MKITVAMITMDRSSRGKANYLPITLANMKRAGVFQSRHLHALHVFDSGSPDGWLRGIINEQGISAECHYPIAGPRLACENCGTALATAGLTDCDYVLFCEDDLDVSDGFLDSVADWLHDHGENGNQYPLFAFGAAYDQINQNFARGATAWVYPVRAFYGTQCFALRPADAVSLGSYVESNPLIGGVRNPNAYDLMFHLWADMKYPGCSFLASVPSFVEHIGRESGCTGKDETHTFPWRGADYRYRSRGRALIAA